MTLRPCSRSQNLWYVGRQTRRGQGRGVLVDVAIGLGRPARCREGRLTLESIQWPSSLAVLKQAANLGNFFSYRLSKPPSCDEVVENPKNSMSEIKFLDVSNTNSFSHVFNFKPSVEVSRNSMLKGHVYVIRPVPLGSSDYRSP